MNTSMHWNTNNIHTTEHDDHTDNTNKENNYDDKKKTQW